MSNGVSFFEGASSFGEKSYETQPGQPSMSQGPVDSPAYNGGEFTKSYDTPKSNQSPMGSGAIVSPTDY